MQEERTRWTIEENVPLAPYTTIGVGGPARFFARVADEAGLMDSLAFARARACPIFVLGGGSNLVVSDRGFEGLVLKMEIAGVRTGADGATLHAGAGTEWDLLVRHAVERRLAGIECLGGIPGTVGAVPIQNVGAYGQEAGDVIAGVRAWDLEGGSFRRFDRDACAFGYRSSLFNRPGGRRYIIVEASFRLRPGDPDRLPRPREALAGLEVRLRLRDTRRGARHPPGEGMIWARIPRTSAGSLQSSLLQRQWRRWQTPSDRGGTDPNTGSAADQVRAAWRSTKPGHHVGKAPHSASMP